MFSTVWIIGYGSFGQFIHTIVSKHFPKISVKVYTKNNNPDWNIFFALQEVAQCDIIFLSIPIKAFAKVTQQLILMINPKTILVDVCTVKIHPTNILQKYENSCKYICTHPMFGPYSYEKKHKSLKDLRIVLTEHNVPSDIFLQIKKLLQKLWLKVLEMTAEQHDQKLAETLFITHLVAQTMKKGKFCRTDIDTVSFGFLMDAVESVSADLQLFQDVYHYNPYCQQSLHHFHNAAKSITKTLEKNDDKENTLQTQRNNIDQIDKKILSLLAQRMQASKEIAKYKHHHNLPIYQSGRWQEVLDNKIQQAKKLWLDEQCIIDIRNTIHQASVEIQKSCTF